MLGTSPTPKESGSSIMVVWLWNIPKHYTLSSRTDEA